MTIKNYPVLALSEGKHQRISLHTDLRINIEGTSATLAATAESQLDNCLVGIGPFSSKANYVKAALDGHPVSVTSIKSGDSLWGAVSVRNKSNFSVEAKAIFE